MTTEIIAKYQKNRPASFVHGFTLPSRGSKQMYFMYATRYLGYSSG